MKVQRDKLQQYQKRIKIVTDRETEVARECLRQGHKDKALLALRRKKYQESLLTKTDQQLAQLQALTSDVEFALVQKDVVFGLQQGTAVLKEIHKEMGGLDKVELIMSETEEAQAYQNVSWMDKADAMKCAKLTGKNRKSTRCWAVRCQTRTRTRWKTSCWQWRGKPTACPPCPMHLRRSKSLCRRFLRAIHSEQERRREHNNGEREKPLQPRRRSCATHTGPRGASEILLIPIYNTQTFTQGTDIYCSSYGEKPGVNRCNRLVMNVFIGTVPRLNRRRRS